jgi:hypothetical protein
MQFDQSKRREFITLLGSAVTACPPRHGRSSRSACGASVFFYPQPQAILCFRPASSIPAEAGAIGLDHWPKRADRHPLGHGQCRRHSQTRGILAYGSSTVGPLMHRTSCFRSPAIQ